PHRTGLGSGPASLPPPDRRLVQPADFALQFLVRGSANPALADDALLVNQKQGREGEDLPLVRDGLFVRALILERPPGDGILLERLGQVFRSIAVHADEDEGFALETVHE